jgi:hypothetical protein
VPEAARFTVAVLLDVPRGAVPGFRAYEDRVLPLLRRHGGRVDRRLRTPDGTTEVHVLSFSSEGAYRGYLTDPERVAHRELLAGVELEQRVVEDLSDVP